MNTERFKAIVEAYGGDPKRWPEAERAEAQAFAQTPDAAAILAEARVLDAALDASDEPAPVSLAFVRDAIASAPKQRAPLSWRPIAAMAACALLGLALGFGGARSALENDAAAIALEIALSGGETG
jgi:hypothetical protein